MKSGGPWNFRGLRPQPREPAREEARPPDTSVGEWLNSVIRSTADDKAAEEERRNQPPLEKSQRRDRIRREATSVRYEGRPYRDERPTDRDERPRRPADHADARGPDRETARPDEGGGNQARREVAVHAAAREETRREAARTREGLGEVHARLDKLGEQLERLGRIDIARRRTASTNTVATAEVRKPQLTGAPPPRRRVMREPALSIDDAVAEIAARQRALESETAASVAAAEPAPSLAAAEPLPPNGPSEPLSPVAAAEPAPAGTVAEAGPATVHEAATPAPAHARGPAPEIETVAPAPPTVPVPAVDLSGLEIQLRQITARIEALQPSGDIEKAVATIRADLAEIGRQVNEAQPRHAMESLEIEVRALAERIDHSRQSGVDANALAGLERGLAEVREALRALTPAESLVGFDEAVNALSQKLDIIVARDDPSALQQLEAAIGGLRGVVSHVASNDTLTRVADDVRALAAQVDGIASNTATEHAVSALEQRIDTLASQVDGIAGNTATGHAVSSLEQRIDTLAAALTASSEAGHAVPRDLEKLLAGLIEKLEWVQLTHTDHAALAHLEDRIAMLVQRFDASDARLGHLEAIERGLADLLVHIEEIRGANAGGAAAVLAPPAAQAIERDVAEIRQSERNTRDSLEAVQGTVEYLVDRLATIESGLRGDAVPRATPEPAATIAPSAPPDETEGVDSGIAPSSPEPTPMEAGPAPSHRVAAARTPIDPTLPPDHPLEPGSAPGRSRPITSAADRIAASEAAIGSVKPPVISDSERPNFIAAARRAAQAAVWEPSGQKTKAEDCVGAAPEPNKLSQRLRKLIVAGSVLLILIGCLRIATRLFSDGGSGASPQVQTEQTTPPTVRPEHSVPPKQPASDASPPPLPNPAPAAPPTTTPPTNPATNAEKPDRQSMVHDGDGEPAAGAAAPSAAEPPGAMAVPSWASPDITGALPRQQPVPNIAPAADQVAGFADDKLPVAIGDPALRKAALAGDPAAAYQVALRFADGRGVSQNNEAAAHWFQRAAQQGLAPAQFRLGGLYEKGLGVKKDLGVARNLYLAAAEKGNAKAMHNLAVLYAEGVAGAPDYDKAAAWFRKAADHGVKDSQYNLGILYARGIGVEQNNAESYKWFALAADQGDKDAAKKRDEMASRLDPQSLAAARLAVKNWTAQPQPDDAINVKMITARDAPAKGSRAHRQN